MKHGLFLKHRKPVSSATEIDHFKREASRLQSLLNEAQNQNSLLKKNLAVAEGHLQEALHLAGRVGNFDQEGIRLLLGNNIESYQDFAGYIVRGFYHVDTPNGQPLEICYPHGLYLSSLSQVLRIIQYESYAELAEMLQIPQSERASTYFVPCSWEERQSELTGDIINRLTLAAPEAHNFALFKKNSVIPIRLDWLSYLLQVEERLERTLSDEEREQAESYYDAVMDQVCSHWHELLPGVIFSTQSAGADFDSDE